MRTKKVKKIVSLFLAVLMCVTTFAGFGTTAYAAEETDEVYLISFPRDGDDNYGGEWGHGSHEFMNGWSTDTSRYTSVYAMGSYNGNICYCISSWKRITVGKALPLYKTTARSPLPEGLPQPRKRQILFPRRWVTGR